MSRVCECVFLHAQPRCPERGCCGHNSQQVTILALNFFGHSLDRTQAYKHRHTRPPCWWRLISADSLLIWKLGSSSAFWEEVNNVRVHLADSGDSHRGRHTKMQTHRHKLAHRLCESVCIDVHADPWVGALCQDWFTHDRTLNFATVSSTGIDVLQSVRQCAKPNWKRKTLQQMAANLEK